MLNAHLISPHNQSRTVLEAYLPRRRHALVGIFSTDNWDIALIHLSKLPWKNEQKPKQMSWTNGKSVFAYPS